MSNPVPVTELARRFCVVAHHADLIPGPAGVVPCGEHRRLAELYLGLTEPNGDKYLKILNEAQVVKHG